jgi:aspartate carbamoyltransferase catalytic subunit
LLDALTIRQRKGSFENLSVLIVGDLAHSRVARSAWHVLTTMGIGELRIAAPADLLPPAQEFSGTKRFTNVDEALKGVDVVMALRIQRERMTSAQIPNDAAYCREFGLTPERLKLAARNAIVMHPAPMNRGVEITDAVADGPQSVIQLQVTNGVAVRMAVLASIVRNTQARRKW